MQVRAEGLLLLPSFSDRCVRLLSCSSASADLAVNVWHGFGSGCRRRLRRREWRQPDSERRDRHR